MAYSTIMEKFFILFDKIPTTRIRVLVTLGLITATGATYLLHSCDVRSLQNQLCVGWEPSVNWLVFLSALAGVDVTQYFAKSYTSIKQSQVAANVANTASNNAAVVATNASDNSANVQSDDDVTSTSDVSELNKDDQLKG